jgi:hypothetical protein
VSKEEGELRVQIQILGGMIYIAISISGLLRESSEFNSSCELFPTFF